MHQDTFLGSRYICMALSPMTLPLLVKNQQLIVFCPQFFNFRRLRANATKQQDYRKHLQKILEIFDNKFLNNFSKSLLRHSAVCLLRPQSPGKAVTLRTASRAQLCGQCVTDMSVYWILTSVGFKPAHRSLNTAPETGQPQCQYSE